MSGWLVVTALVVALDVAVVAVMLPGVARLRYRAVMTYSVTARQIILAGLAIAVAGASEALRWLPILT